MHYSAYITRNALSEFEADTQRELVVLLVDHYFDRQTPISCLRVTYTDDERNEYDLDVDMFNDWIVREWERQKADYVSEGSYAGNGFISHAL